jgi:hypothetical protein
MRKAKRDRRPYIGLHKECVNSKEYGVLSLRAKALYQLFKVKYNPNKNGGLVRLPYREVMKKNWRGLRQFNTMSATFKELLDQGWMEKAEHGGLYGKAVSYRITFKCDNYGKGFR